MFARLFRSNKQYTDIKTHNRGELETCATHDQLNARPEATNIFVLPCKNGNKLQFCNSDVFPVILNPNPYISIGKLPDRYDIGSVPSKRCFVILSMAGSFVRAVYISDNMFRVGLSKTRTPIHEEF